MFSKLKMQTLRIVFYLGCQLLTLGDTLRCFQCNNIPFPRDCAHIAVCNTNEHCYTEQVVTASGNIVYNTGCTSNLRCQGNDALVVGRRLVNKNRRSVDVVTCTECCSGNFCNVKGCGTTDVSPSHRGPYCYNCDALIDPGACEHVAFCYPGEVCQLYSPDEYKGSLDKIYRSKCAMATACNKTSSSFHANRCADVCCSTDFCNSQCIHQSVVPTQHITSTTTTTTTTHHHKPTYPSVNISIPDSGRRDCAAQKDYIYLHNDYSQLCVHIIQTRKSWNHAEDVCNKESGNLVVLDTIAKAVLLRNSMLANHAYQGHGDYWIGAKHSSQENYFKWSNGMDVDPSKSLWADGEPNLRHGTCIALLDNHIHSQQFKWHDSSCDKTKNFICEHHL